MEQADTERYLLTVAGGEPSTTAEIAEAAGDAENRTREVLDRLAADGLVRSKPVGSERVWWGVSAADRPAEDDPLVPPERAIESFMRVTPVGTLLVDESGEVVRANDRARELLGTDPTVDALFLPWVAGRPDAVVDRVVADGAVLADEEAVHAVDGGTLRLSVSAAPVTGPRGVERVFVVFDPVGGDVDAERVESERLARLVSTFRATTTAVVEAATRAQLESSLCHRLVDDGPYAFAWVGRVRWVSETVQPVHYAIRGGAAGARGWRPESTDHIDIVPAANVVHDRTAVVYDELDPAGDDPGESWAQTVRDRGFRSMAAVPLEYGGRLFGVLSVFSREPGAFGSDRTADVAVRTGDAAVLTQLGRTVGHALSALERRDALLSERFVEVEYRSESMAREFAALPAGAEVVLDQTVPLEDDAYVDFYRVSGADAESLAAVLTDRDDVETVRVIESAPDGGRVAAQTVQPTLAGVFATHGGRTKEVRVGGGVLEVRAELPQFADVQEITRLIGDRFGDATLSGYRTDVRERRRSEDVGAELRDALTDRQWSALELAYYGGYFGWPRRGGSLEDIAGDMGVTAQTANEHLRKAEAKVFAVLFDSVRSDGGHRASD